MTPDPGKQATSSGDVFVSYASADAGVAKSIVENLEQHGRRCWMAPRDVKPGTVYAEAIVRAINEAKALVLVLSVNTMASAHVGREVERAASKRKPIVAFRVDSTPLSEELEYFLSNSQWIDVPALGLPAALAKLAEAVREGPRAPPQGMSTTKHAGGTKKRFVVVAAILVCVGVAAGLGLHFWSLNRRAAQQAAAITGKSIAVLPFTDMSEKHDQEYFGDGMAEEILDLLAKIPGLTVIGRTSSFQFKGKNEDLKTIGTKLNAAHVLEGSVRKSGEQVRITAQLINTRTGAHEWSETYDRQFGDVLKLQDAIAAAVVRELQLTVAPEDLNSRASVKNSDTYDLILRGRHALDRWDKEGLDEAVTLFQQALDRDPTSADAAAELAFAYYDQADFGFLPTAAGFEQARRMATNALKLDPKNVLAHYALGLIQFIYDWDWAAAKREFQQVATLAPGGSYALVGESVISGTLGRWDDVLRLFKATIVQDPLDANQLQNLAIFQLFRGHLPEAEAAMRRALDVRPTLFYGHNNLGLVLLARGDRDGALREMQQETQDDAKQQGLAMVYYALGRKAESDAALGRLIKEYADAEAFEIAEVYAFRGQPGEATHWLERAYVQKDFNMYMLNRDALLKNLEGDPRYKALLRKMKLPE